MIECLDNFNGSIVMCCIVEGEIAVIVFLGGSFGKDLEEEFHAVEGAFFPGGEVEGEVAVVVGHGGGFGV